MSVEGAWESPRHAQGGHGLISDFVRGGFETEGDSRQRGTREGGLKGGGEEGRLQKRLGIFATWKGCTLLTL
jgi:hypothetical protein